MIEEYDFGRIRIKGKTFYRDVIIYPEGVDPEWWRKEGHRLSPEDLPALLSKSPEILIIGTGASGVMQVPEGVRKEIEGRGVEVIILDTKRACEEYNRLTGAGTKKRVVAALHLTC